MDTKRGETVNTNTHVRKRGPRSIVVATALAAYGAFRRSSRPVVAGHSSRPTRPGRRVGASAAGALIALAALLAVPVPASAQSDIWSATMTVGTQLPSSIGYSSILGHGTLSATTFAIERISYTVRVLDYDPTSGTLSLIVTGGELPESVVLHLGSRSFGVTDAISEESTVGGVDYFIYRWTGSGLSWANGDTVVVRITVSPTLSIEAVSDTIEFGGIARFTVSRTGSTDEKLYYRIRLKETARTGEGALGPGESTDTVIHMARDEDNDGNPICSITFVLVPRDPYIVSTDSVATVTVSPSPGDTCSTENPSTPTPPSSLAVTPNPHAIEGLDQTLDFVVTLGPAASSQVTVDYATVDGTATAGADYTATSGTLTFEVGEGRKTVAVPIVDDEVEDNRESVFLKLSNPSGAELHPVYFRQKGYIFNSEAESLLTASFEDMPGSHDGENTFTFGLTFSEELENLSYSAVRDHAFDVTDGAVRDAAPKQQGSNVRWTITVEPDSRAAVQITLPETTDCNASGAICTSDGRPLSRSLSATVAGPVTVPAVSVSDASATEGDTVEFTVSLSAESSQQVTVGYATSGGTAESDTDFTPASGTLTFEPDEMSKTVSVATTDDSADEDHETFTLTLSSPSNATLGDHTATGTINDDDSASPLTATFKNVPESHDGTSAFTFDVEFSEDIGIGFESLRDSAFSVTNGDVTRARRVDGRNDLRRITVKPDSREAVTITLPGGRACFTAGAICTNGDDPRPLSNSPSATVDGPGAATNTAATGAPTIGGTARVGETLAASVSGVSDADGLDDANFAYQWIRGSTDVQGATGSSYTLASADEGERIKVRVDFTDDAGFDESLTSAATDVVEGPPATNTAATGAPTIGGTARVGETLAASVSGVSDADGLNNADFAYQWIRGSTDVQGATGSSYTLASADEGERIKVRVDFTDDAGFDESLTSAATGVVEGPAEALTATFSDVPASHTGAEFTFGLRFSEEFSSLSYVTLRDDAFAVTGGEVRKAKRQQQGSNMAWNITVGPTSATDTVGITLPETTDCNASGAICTDDGRPLSHSLSATVEPAASAGASMDAGGGDVVDEALALLDGVTPDEASAALVGEGGLSEAQLDALDRLGNRNGRYDLGDVLSWRDRCRTGEARCGGTSSDPGPASSALLFGAAAAGRRRPSGRANRRGRGRPRTRAAACRAAVLLAAVTAWSCTGDLVGPPADEPDPGAPAAEGPVPATTPQGPGFLTVEWTAPAATRAVGVLLELEGPGIEAAEAPGRELYQYGAANRHQLVVAGSLDAGPLVRFRVPDRARLAEYRVRVLQVTGEDYGLGDVDEYRAAITSN